MTSLTRNSEHLINGHNGGGAHVCEVCGVNQSSRGKLFASVHDVWQHKRKRHPEVCEAGVPKAAAAPKRIRQKTLRPAPDAHQGTHQVQFCPHCGFHLQVVHAAMEFVNGSTQP